MSDNQEQKDCGVAPLLGGAWRSFLARGGSLFWAHLLAVLILLAGGAACGLPYFILFGPIWFGLAAMARHLDHGAATTAGDLFSGFNQKVFVPTLVIGLMFLLLPAAAQTILLIPLQGIFMMWMTAIEFDFRLLSPMQGAWILVLALILLFFAMLVQVLAIFLLAPAMFIYLDRPHQEPWLVVKCAAIGVWRHRGWWTKLWAWLGLIHLLGVFTCGLAWLVMHPWMALVLSRAYDLRKGDFSPPPDPAVAPPPIPQSPPRFP